MAGGSGRTSPCSRSATGRRRRPCPPDGRRAAVAATSCATAGSSRSTAASGRATATATARRASRSSTGSSRSTASRSRSAGSPATTSRTPSPPPARRAASGVTLAQLRDGLADFQPSSERSPGRLNLFRLGARIVIVDFAHNEAGVNAVLDVAEGIAGGAAGRAAPVTAIIGTAGDRPDDTLRGIGRIAGKRAQRVAIKETLKYLRGRSRESVVGEILAGVAASGRSTSDVPVYESETDGTPRRAGPERQASSRPDAPRVIVLMCHEEREEVFALLAELGARPIDVASELTTLIPRLQERPRRG